MKEVANKNEALWIWTRVMFYSSLGLWVINLIFDTESENIALGFLWFGSIIASFVLSIIHLAKYKQKGFAVTALVISSIFVLLIMVGILIAAIQDIMGLM